MENSKLKQIITKFIKANKQIDADFKEFIIDFVYDIAVNEQDRRLVEKIERLATTPISFGVLKGPSGACLFGFECLDNGEIVITKKIIINHIDGLLSELSGTQKELNGTIAHEIGHLLTADFEIRGNFIVCKSGVSYSEYNLRKGLSTDVLYDGLGEAINSLRTSDRLKRMGVGFKDSGYLIAQDLLSALRTVYSLDNAIIKADETHDVRIISQAIKEHESFIHSKVSAREILLEIDKAFNTIYKNYSSDIPADKAIKSSLIAIDKLIKFLNISVTLPMDVEEYERELIRFKYVDKGVEIQQGKVLEKNDNLVR